MILPHGTCQRMQIAATFRSGTSRGFTLIEMLVAVLIFALISVGAYSTLDAAQDAQETMRVRGERFIQLQKAITMLSRDYRQLSFRRARDQYGERTPIVRGAGDSEKDEIFIEFTRSGWRNPAQLPRSTLEHVIYRFEDGQLIRYSFLLLDQAQTSTPVRRVLIDGVLSMKIEFLKSAGQGLPDQWAKEWPIGGSVNVEDSNKTPRGIKITLDVEGIGEVHRVLP